MTPEQLAALLQTVSGHLQATTPEGERSLQLARQRIAASLLRSEDSGSEQLFANSDFYAPENIRADTKTQLAEMAARTAKQTGDDGLRTYIRTVPVNNAQLSGSTPEWAVGAKAIETMGPFLNNEGRVVWVDVFKVVKLVTLYMGMQPVLMFSTLQLGQTPQPAAGANYTINAGSVWINANLLSPTAPVARFVGVNVKSGSIKLNIAPTLQNGKLTLNPATVVTVSLVPEQAADGGAASPSAYGKDAREAKYALPTAWNFTWNGGTKKVTAMAVGTATCQLYGQAMTFTYNPVPNPTIGYNALLNAVFIEWKADVATFTASKNKSPFITLSGTAAILKSFWILPAAVLDVNAPLQAEGSGAVMLECDKGLRATWTSLQNEDSRLQHPFITGSPGGLSIIDFIADTSGASQHFDLWKDGKHPYRSSVDLLFLNNTPLSITISSALGQELVAAQCNSDFKVDRPVKANGEVFDIRSKASLLMLSASATQRLLYLYDDNLLADSLSPTTSTKPPKPLKPVAIALENALFTVSPVSGCLLFGECDATWQKVTRANFFLTYMLLRYLPTLPDPYVGKLRMLERLFGRVEGEQQRNSSFFSLLICAVKYTAANADKDNVTTAFYFGTLPEGVFNLPGEMGRTQPVNPAAPLQPVREQLSTLQKTGTQIRLETLAGGITLKGRLNKDQLNLLTNLRINPLRRINSYRTAVKINTVTLEKRKAESNKYLQNLNLRPDFTVPALADTPAITGTVPDDQLRQQATNAGKTSGAQAFWETSLVGSRLQEPFALLDVSSNANQMGVSLSGEMLFVKTGSIETNDDQRAAVIKSGFPFLIDGMQVKAKGSLVKTFLLPQVAWEPTINLTPPDKDGNPPVKLPMDPEAGFLYYENDGGPTRIWNNSTKPVALAPLPAVTSLLEEFKSDPKNFTVSAFTLPFGLKAINYVSKNFIETTKPDFTNLRPKFRKNADGTYGLEGGIQLSFRGGDFSKPVPTPAEKDSPMFPGYTVQFNNLLDMVGMPANTSNLGHRVTQIFNNEFLTGVLSKSTKLKDSRGVPVSRMDLTGYGANIFSEWVSPTAAMAQTSQAKFDIMMGRTAHEVIQVKSILYPWGIRVVRTITVFRSDTALIYRTDSGWKAESDGKFDFSYRYLLLGKDPTSPDLKSTDFKIVDEPYNFYPGVVRGLFNVRNIKDAPTVKEYITTNKIGINDIYVDGIKGVEMQNDTGIAFEEPVLCGAVYFDADVEIEGVVQGHINSRVVSKKILGYVQVAPAGIPLTPKQLKELLQQQGNSIGGDLDAVIDINNNNQLMRLSRFDVNNSVDKDGKPVFVVAARGQVALPKSGSWSVVQHDAGSGEVTQLPKDVTVPLIRTGKWIKEKVVNPADVTSKLLRIAHPMEILRNPGDQTINIGFLQTTATQKALFLTPAFAFVSGSATKMMLSKTPPIFADAYRLMEGNSIFPNIGNAIDNFGKAFPLLNGKDSLGNTVKAFKTSSLTDAGAQVFELMEVTTKKAGDAIIDQGMSLLQQNANNAVDKAIKFDVPQFEVPLVDTKALRIYIEYKTGKNGASPASYVDSKLNFDVDSFATDLGKQWKSRLNNLAMVVDLGDMKRLMTIKGNFDAGKSKEAGFEGGPDDNKSGLPVPEIEFSDALQPVIDILEILAKLSTGDYAGAMKKGLKVAMSNAGEIWEYKFEATKEIPLVRFPPTDELYYSAQTPLKLEASLALGVYFNAALKVTTDPKQLLPTAGAFLKFHGGLQVMCVSVGVGSIFAVGTVDVKIAADTKVGPSLTLAFGFGVQIVVSLPVVGHASVTYMMGIEMSANKDKVVIAALMLFKGEAELLGGLVGITICIEAKGIVVRDLVKDETIASAQVTFALDISIFLVIDISFSKTWGEDRLLA